ncbi:RHS repeat-associated core domain-containing protein [Acinetobacter rongchengensis]|uniref:RHS repeat-associated core domain-containing protein n=1 Tax=Acinetobacter rongchengensis TaxID=2419601 RepID=A0A3A8F410_9GAMM|nr:RHS repeat-associated core domain-containing protein [Acinetobacter rongchengensis]
MSNDAEVGIFYNYFRDYDPITGRYIESDPIGLDGGLNTYGYVGGNALHLVDPNGLAAALPLIGLGETINLGLAISLIYNMPDIDSTPQSKPAKCDQEPDDLCEQLALAEAKAGAGYQIMHGEKNG